MEMELNSKKAKQETSNQQANRKTMSREVTYLMKKMAQSVRSFHLGGGVVSIGNKLIIHFAEWARQQVGPYSEIITR